MLTNRLMHSFTEGHAGRFFFLEDADKLFHSFLLLTGERGNQIEEVLRLHDGASPSTILAHEGSAWGLTSLNKSHGLNLSVSVSILVGSLARNSCTSCDFAVHPCRSIIIQATLR